MDAIACKCPTCGAPVPNDAFNFDEETRTFVANGVAVQFTERQSRVIGALWRARRRGGFDGLQLLADAVYGDDPDGGPENAANTMSATLWAIRKKLEPAGYTVPYRYGNPRARFQIIKSEECA
jgi:hypothetical protein